MLDCRGQTEVGHILPDMRGETNLFQQIVFSTVLGFKLPFLALMFSPPRCATHRVRHAMQVLPYADSGLTSSHGRKPLRSCWYG